VIVQQRLLEHQPSWEQEKVGLKSMEQSRIMGLSLGGGQLAGHLLRGPGI
jgi:hypothetical protein